MSEEENRSWFGRHKILSALIVIFIAIIALVAFQPQPQGEKAPETHKEMQTLIELTGSGSKSTEKFTVDGDWDLEWDYNCSNFGQPSNFIVNVFNEDATQNFDNASVNQLGATGKDVQHYHKDGIFYLQVTSTCDWHIKVKG